MRVLLLVLAIVLVAGFAAQNWAEINRSSDLLFGPIVMTAPLGMILLTLLGVALVAFLIASFASRTRALVETRHHHKTLEAQRELADKAEASRFTELRTHLERMHREMREELAQLNRSMTNRFTGMESRFDARSRGWGPATPHEEVRAEHALADAQAERARADEARANAAREEALRGDPERRSGLFRNWR
jgi:uncharacterized integral membrane protein